MWSDRDFSVLLVRVSSLRYRSLLLFLIRASLLALFNYVTASLDLELMRLSRSQTTHVPVLISLTLTSARAFSLSLSRARSLSRSRSRSLALPLDSCTQYGVECAQLEEHSVGEA